MKQKKATFHFHVIHHARFRFKLRQQGRDKYEKKTCAQSPYEKNIFFKIFFFPISIFQKTDSAHERQHARNVNYHESVANVTYAEMLMFLAFWKYNFTWL